LTRLIISWNWQTSKRKVVDQNSWILVLRLAQQAVGTDDCTHTSQYHFQNPYKNKLTQTAYPLKKSLGSNTLSGSPKKQSNRKEHHTLPQSPERMSRETEKAPVKRVTIWIRNQRKETRVLIELRGNSLLFIWEYTIYIISFNIFFIICCYLSPSFILSKFQFA
jgi:hypothetical protein